MNMFSCLGQIGDFGASHVVQQAEAIVADTAFLLQTLARLVRERTMMHLRSAQFHNGALHMHTRCCVTGRQAWRLVRFKLTTRKRTNPACGCQAAGSSGGQPDKRNLHKRSVQAEQALESLTSSSKIGSEYGEVGGFQRTCKHSIPDDRLRLHEHLL